MPIRHDLMTSYYELMNTDVYMTITRNEWVKFEKQGSGLTRLGLE